MTRSTIIRAIIEAAKKTEFKTTLLKKTGHDLWMTDTERMKEIIRKKKKRKK